MKRRRLWRRSATLPKIAFSSRLVGSKRLKVSRRLAELDSRGVAAAAPAGWLSFESVPGYAAAPLPFSSPNASPAAFSSTWR